MAYRKTKATALRGDARGRAEGYRSGLEEIVSAQLRQHGIDFTYEGHTLKYTVPARLARYTPDFILPNGIIVETKGRFVTADRTKHRLIREQHPDLDIRFVFSNPRNKIGKKSATTYAMWCERLGIPFAAKLIPEDWLTEPANKASLAAIAKLIAKEPRK